MRFTSERLFHAELQTITSDSRGFPLQHPFKVIELNGYLHSQSSVDTLIKYLKKQKPKLPERPS